MGARIENETELIQTYLAPLAAAAPGALGLRDDASYLTPPPGADLVITTDPIAAGVHFLASDRADDIAWKALAVNISDLAAKGAVPLAYTMALALPAAPERSWMEQFALGLAGAQQEFGCTLIGGDTDRTVVISGDTAPSPRLEAASKGADLLVHEGLSPNLVGVQHEAAVKVGNRTITAITHDMA